jgi:hypothetical protein
VREPKIKAGDEEAKKHRPESRQEAYKAFDRREPGWIKVELKPSPKEREAA